MSAFKPIVKAQDKPTITSSKPNSKKSLPQHLSHQLATDFLKNYAKIILLLLIEHLDQMGLRQQFQSCVGTLQSIQGREISLQEIHGVMTQKWFVERINLAALVSNMSNKTLLRSKIRQKFCYLLIIIQIFSHPDLQTPQFKRLVSDRAEQISKIQLPNDQIFRYSSAVAYLLMIFDEVLYRSLNGNYNTQLPRNDPHKQQYADEQNSFQSQKKRKQATLKYPYSNHLSNIIQYLNYFKGDNQTLRDKMEEVKQKIKKEESEMHKRHNLARYVPEWSYFNQIVVNNCYRAKVDKRKIQLSQFNSWIQQFKQKSTSLRGYEMMLKRGKQGRIPFKHIVIIHPPAQ